MSLIIFSFLQAYVSSGFAVAICGQSLIESKGIGVESFSLRKLADIQVIIFYLLDIPVKVQSKFRLWNTYKILQRKIIFLNFLSIPMNGQTMWLL